MVYLYKRQDKHLARHLFSAKHLNTVEKATFKEREKRQDNIVLDHINERHGKIINRPTNSNAEGEKAFTQTFKHSGGRCRRVTVMGERGKRRSGKSLIK